MATLIVLDRPDPRHVPWFAMGVPLALEDRAVDIDIDAGLDQNGIVGRRCADWIRAHRQCHQVGVNSQFRQATNRVVCDLAAVSG